MTHPETTMANLPQSLEEAIAQAKTAVQSALEDGYSLVQVEFVYPEIALQAQNLAWQFAEMFADYGAGLRILFPDTGAAALARRDWGEIPYQVGDLGSSRTPIDYKIADSDQVFLVVCPSAVEVSQVEKLHNLAGDRPVVLLIPQLEDVAIVGIGYAARQLRERFIHLIQSAYYIRPLDGAMVWRQYPSPWQVFLETTEDQFELVSEQTEKPLGEALERILNQATQTEDGDRETQRKAPGLLSKVQSFIRALSQ